MSRRLLTRILEAERKFVPTPRLLTALRTENVASPNKITVPNDVLAKPHTELPPVCIFQSVKKLNTEGITDTYYDDNAALCSRGVWVRFREQYFMNDRDVPHKTMIGSLGLATNAGWEAKVDRGGDYRNSRFEEYQSPTEISAITWLVDGQFKVVVDETDWGHTVGEVELSKQIQFEERDMLEAAISSLESEGAAPSPLDKMDTEIKAFMYRYKALFGGDRPVGKLSAYFRAKEEIDEKRKARKELRDSEIP
ncbi:hypothetical protein NA57DRAFT_59603 [Rhizodiscina lignyota]|uniref:Thiamine-triphosphatase n=1 Tax=Rhizodiscina lignyota TaxID=1504668 RepID=A0A9P4I5Z4_9PEZI|nr:hypothetical protein NA57DRAFT_59603 [Rhizodiscina lignyota]